MKRLALITTCCVVALGTAAHAQVTNVTGSSTTQVQLDSTFNFTGGGPGLVSQGGGAAYYSSFSNTPSEITFESANASLKGDNSPTSTSTSSVDITIKNGGSAPVNPVLKSQITAGGLGFYLADMTPNTPTVGCHGSGIFGAGGDPFGGCAQTKGGQTFQDINTGRTGFRPGEVLASAEFEFTVTAGGKQVYDFTGIQEITEGDGNFIIGPLVVSIDGVLQDLTHLTPGDPGSADGYGWAASDVSIPLDGLLGSGASEDVVYTATVTTFSELGCTTSDSNVCLVPYASFGDPIGKSGGTSNAFRTLGPATDLRRLDSGTDGIAFVDDWAPQRFAVPTFDFNNGILSFNSIPEPKTWMSLILGFGLIGAALRRRRVLSYT